MGYEEGHDIGREESLGKGVSWKTGSRERKVNVIKYTYQILKENIILKKEKSGREILTSPTLWGRKKVPLAR